MTTQRKCHLAIDIIVTIFGVCTWAIVHLAQQATLLEVALYQTLCVVLRSSLVWLISRISMCRTLNITLLGCSPWPPPASFLFFVDRYFKKKAPRNRSQGPSCVRELFSQRENTTVNRIHIRHKKEGAEAPSLRSGAKIDLPTHILDSAHDCRQRLRL